MAQFVEKLKGQLPREVTIAQEIDENKLKQALEESVRKTFEEKFRPVETELRRQIDDMKRTAEQKVTQMRQSQETEQKRVTDMFTGLKAQQEEQTQLVNAITGVVQQKQQQLVASQGELRGKVDVLRENVERLYREAYQLQSEISARKQKAAICSELTSIGRFVKFQVQNKKQYYLENVCLRFTNDQLTHDSTPLQFVQPQEGPVGIPSQQTVEMKAELPDLPPNATYQVCLVMNGVEISNAVQFAI